MSRPTSFNAMRAAVERALQLDPEGDAEAACRAAAQALQQPLEAVLLVAHQVGLLYTARPASTRIRCSSPVSVPVAEELAA